MQGGGSPFDAIVDFTYTVLTATARTVAFSSVAIVRAAYGGRSSPYTAPGGRDMPVERDLYEGTTGVDVLAMQKDLVAEGYLSPANATGYVPEPARVLTLYPVSSNPRLKAT